MSCVTMVAGDGEAAATATMVGLYHHYLLRGQQLAAAVQGIVKQHPGSAIALGREATTRESSQCRFYAKIQYRIIFAMPSIVVL